MNLTNTYLSKNAPQGVKGLSYKQNAAKQNKNDETFNDLDERVKKENLTESGRKCGKYQLTNRKILGIIIGVILLISVIVIPIAVVYSGRESNVDNNTERTQIILNGRKIILMSRIVPSDKGDYKVISAVGGKTSAMEPLTGITLRCKDEESTNDSECSITVPILSLLNSAVLDGLETKEDWLREYNKNPRSFVTKLYDLLIPTIQGHNSGEKAELRILEIDEKILVDIRYNSVTNRFEILQFDPETESSSSSSIIETKVEVKDDSWVQGFLEETAKKLKSTVLDNIDVIKTHSQKILKDQEQFAKEEQIKGDQENALINRCRAVSSDVFRCSQKAAEILVPGFELDKFPDAVLTYAFVITVHDHCKVQ